MPRIAFLPILAAALAVTVVNSYSTLAGPGPIVDFVPSADSSAQANGGSRGSQSLQAKEGEERQGADKVAQAIADEFGVTKEEVIAHHDEGIGFGALFKLYKFARAQGISIDELLATIPVGENGEREFRFGQLRKALTEDQRALYETPVPRTSASWSPARTRSSTNQTLKAKTRARRLDLLAATATSLPVRPRNSSGAEPTAPNASATDATETRSYAICGVVRRLSGTLQRTTAG